MVRKSKSKSIVMHQNNARVLQKMIAGLTVNEANQFEVMLELKIRATLTVSGYPQVHRPSLLEHQPQVRGHPT